MEIGKLRKASFCVLLTTNYLLLTTLFLGCAYNFKGFVLHDVRSIAIPVFENNTIKYGIEDVLTRTVIASFVSDARLKVVDRNKAESILLGEITHYNRAPFSYDDQANVKDYKIELSIKLIYKDKADKVLTEKVIQDWCVYSANETEETGIEELCKKLAEDILKGIMEGW